MRCSERLRPVTAAARDRHHLTATGSRRACPPPSLSLRSLAVATAMPENEPSEESKERIWSAFKVWLVDTIGVSDTFLTDTFIDGLTDDDDWSFVIRFHALLEAGLNHLLVTHFNDHRMNDLLSDLSTNGRTGKIAYIKRLDLLSPAARTFIRVFSVARNNAVHDVRQTRFSLRAYAESLPANERDSWRTGLS